MTREEIKELLKFIIRKCDLVINNENYTTDEYAQDKIEDIAEICHRVLDGQFGEIIETSHPSLPSNLDEAAWEHAPDLPSYIGNGISIAPQSNQVLRDSFKAGAEWMAGQGVKFDSEMSWLDSFGFQILWPEDTSIFDCFNDGDKVVVQIRKK